MAGGGGGGGGGGEEGSHSHPSHKLQLELILS